MTSGIKEAYEIAVKELEHLTNSSEPDFRLEQYELYDNKPETDVIISYLVKKPHHGMGSAIFELFERVYKRVTINTKGEVKGVYMYNPN